MTAEIYSIGYGNRSLETVIDQLKRANVEYVIDVRSSPFSKFSPDFSKDILESNLSQRGMKYVFMGDQLGGRPKSDDCYSDGKADYSKIAEKGFFKKGIARLKSAYNQNLRICLLCSEGAPSQCHRAKLIAVALDDAGIRVTHILPDGSYQSQDSVIASLTNGQADMFGDSFTSRKSYR
ncbi:DUF488 family protein [Qipengyuania sp.]|uniref:DUF488 domain-containing protein n=1 Tax=Qipengyuania sp. TaxID=2004515 RepID=UPI003735BCE5